MEFASVAVGKGGRRAPAGALEAPWWKLLGRRYGHVLHSMCSYMGSFPAGLPRYFIEQFSEPGDVVLDPFAGSGTTLIAAEKSGRLARLIELDPKYVDVIVRRWQDWTGKQATRESDGVVFDDQAANASSVISQ